MAVVKPFRGLRPPRAIVKDLACLPYDVMNTEEAGKMAKGKECSLLHITRSEIDFPADIDTHAEGSITNHLRTSLNGRKKDGSFRIRYQVTIFMPRQ